MSRRFETTTPDSPELAEYKLACKRSVNTYFTEWTLLLKAANVAKVTARYAGGGDDGAIEEIKFFKRDGANLVEFEPVMATKRQVTNHGYTYEEGRFESFIYDLMGKRGYYNQNAGSQGEIVWDIEQDMLVHQHGNNEYDAEAEVDEDGNLKGSEEYSSPIVTQEHTFLGVDDLSGRWYEP